MENKLNPNLVDHNLDSTSSSGLVLVENRPVLQTDGTPAPGLHNVWISLNNPGQLNSYTTGMVKELILAFRKASSDRAAVAVVFTAVGERAFCTGGNTKEYAEYYAGRPQEYRQYMRLFNDMVSSILACDKPVMHQSMRRCVVPEQQRDINPFPQLKMYPA